MKKLRVLLLCAVVALAAVGIAACGGEKTEYTVTFETAGGGALEPQTVKAGEKAQKPDDPSKTGWTFTGWELDGAAYTFTEPVNANITLVAKYVSVLGGAGTVIDPITIDSAAEWTQLSELLSSGAPDYATSMYKQTANITSALTAPIASFSGSYDGGGFTIETTQPLFAELSGRVENLKIQGDLSGGDRTALLALTTNSAQIAHCSASGSLNTIRGIAGGLVAVQNGGRIEYSTANVVIDAHVAGGIAGESSGAIVNCSASGEITADENGGGITGRLLADGLVQNGGFGGSVRSTSAAGGIVGLKEAGSAVYRGFTYGGPVIGQSAGGIVGSFTSDIMAYEDVLDSVVAESVTVRASANETECEGETVVESFANFALPASVWNVTGANPVLNETIGALPAQVEITVDGNKTSVAYGAHAQNDMFTSDYKHFSSALEIDSAVVLQTVTVTTEALYGEFTDAHAELSFGQNGTATYTPGQGESAKTLTYTGARANFLTYRGYDPTTYEPFTQTYGEHVYGYTDGQTEYAFTIRKQTILDEYVGSLYMFVNRDGEWTTIHNWAPKGSGFAGSYYMLAAYSEDYETHDINQTHAYLTVDGTYTVENVVASAGSMRQVGYYPTNYMVVTEYILSGETEPTSSNGREIWSRGMYGMYYGATPVSDTYTTAFTFMNEQNITGFCYYDNGVLTDGTHSSLDFSTWEYVKKTYTVSDAVLEHQYVYDDAQDEWQKAPVPQWFDGNAKYVFDTAAHTVTVTAGNGAPQTVSYTAPSATQNYITFTVNNKPYTLAIGVNTVGDYRLYSVQTPSEFVALKYVEDYFDGTWFIGDDTLTIANGAVRWNSTDATDVSNAMYNGARAVYFTIDEDEYYLAQFSGGDVARLYCNNRFVSYAVNSNTTDQYNGVFVTVQNGVKIMLIVQDGGAFMYKAGDDDAVQGNIRVAYGEDTQSLMMLFTVGSESYAAMRMNESELIVVNAQADMMFFTSPSTLSDYDIYETLTNGPEMLTITTDERAEFTRYNRGGTPSAPVALTLDFDFLVERVILTYTENGETYFFSLRDGSALQNLYFGRVLNDDVEIIANFISDSEFTKLVGTYANVSESVTDTITVTSEGTVTETYKYADGRTQVVTPVWMPIMMLVSLDSDEVTVGLAMQASGSNIYAYAQLRGIALSFFGGDVMYYNPDVAAFAGTAYRGSNGGMLWFEDGNFVYNGTVYSDLNITATANGATVEITVGYSPVTVTFVQNGTTLSATVGTETFTPSDKPEVSELPIGSFRVGNAVYTISKAAFGDGKTLQFATIDGETVTGNSYTYNGTRYLSGNTIAHFFSHYSGGEMYLWKDGDTWKFSADGTGGTTATPETKTVTNIYGKYTATDAENITLQSGFMGPELKIGETYYDYVASFYANDTYTVKFSDMPGTTVYYVRVTFGLFGVESIKLGTTFAASDADVTYTPDLGLPPLPPAP